MAIFKDKQQISGAVFSHQVHSLSSQRRAGLVEDMETFLVVWMEGQIQECIQLSLLTTKAETRSFCYLLKQSSDYPVYIGNCLQPAVGGSEMSKGTIIFLRIRSVVRQQVPS